VNLLTRDEKIHFIIESIKAFEDVTLAASHFENHTEQEIDKQVDWYDYLWEK
jgi:hypothetical protein